MSGPELQASSWEPWFDRQQSEGWDDWGSPQRPADRKWEPPEQQVQAGRDTAGSAGSWAGQAPDQVRPQAKWSNAGHVWWCSAWSGSRAQQPLHKLGLCMLYTYPAGTIFT